MVSNNLQFYEILISNATFYEIRNTNLFWIVQPRNCYLQKEIANPIEAVSRHSYNTRANRQVEQHNYLEVYTKKNNALRNKTYSSPSQKIPA